MKSYFAAFLLLIMTTNLAVTLVHQLHGDKMYVSTEFGTDDTDEDGKSKTEKEKEKESFAFSCIPTLGNAWRSAPDGHSKSLIHKDDRPVSERHTFLPELPPEA